MRVACEKLFLFGGFPTVSIGSIGVLLSVALCERGLEEGFAGRGAHLWMSGWETSWRGLLLNWEQGLICGWQNLLGLG